MKKRFDNIRGISREFLTSLPVLLAIFMIFSLAMVFGYASDEIKTTKAMHLDSHRLFISDVYNEVKERDNVWSEPIYENQFVRVTFERNLTSSNDVTVYARNNQGLNTYIEVYYPNSNKKITEFPVITDEKYYKVYLTRMQGFHDTFDLKIKNLDNDENAYLVFDHIIDPTQTYGDSLSGCGCEQTAGSGGPATCSIFCEHNFTVPSSAESGFIQEIRYNYSIDTDKQPGGQNIQSSQHEGWFDRDQTEGNGNEAQVGSFSTTTEDVHIGQWTKALANADGFNNSNCPTFSSNYCTWDILANGTLTGTASNKNAVVNITITAVEYVWNYTEAPDTAAPTWSNNETNASDATKTGQIVYFNVTFSDDNPANYTFAINHTGIWVNYTGSYTSGVPIQNISNITATRGQFVSWYFWANDTASPSNTNQTDTWNFTVANTAPTTPTTLTLTDPIKVTETLTATASGSTDADDDSITYYYEFYNTNDTNTTQAYSTTNTYTIQLTDAHDNIRVRAKAYDEYDFSGEKENNSQVNDTAPTDPTDISEFPANLYVGNTLTLTATGGSDADGDTITYYYKFYNVNDTNTTQDWSATNSYTIQTTDAHDEIRVYAKSTTVYANSSGAYYESDQVENTAPTFTQALSDTSLYHNVNLSYQVNATDADSDTINYADNTTLFNIDSNGLIENDPVIADTGNHSILITISDSYGGSNTDTFNYEVKNRPPENLTIVYPTNNTYLNDKNVSLNVSAADPEGDPITYYYFVNESFNQSSSSNITINFTDAKHNWSVKAGDGQANSSMSSTYYFVIDTTYPTISVTFPANNSYLDQTWINITGTASDTNNDSVVINDTRFGLNTGTYQSWNFTNTSIADGTYSVLITANDSANNTNSTNVIFTIDKTAPAWDNNLTNASDSTKNGESVYFNVTFTDDNPDTYIFFINQTGNWVNYTGSYISGTPIQNISTIIATEGQFVSWYFWANDTLGNSNQTDVWNFTIAVADTDYPVIELQAPANDSSWTASNSVNFTYNVSDATSGITNCSLYINDSLNTTDTSVTELINQSFDSIGMSNGYYNWSVKCFDDSSNYNSNTSATWYLTVNYVVDAYPTWSDNKTNASDATKTQQSVYFNVTLDDDSAGSYQIFSLYNGSDWVNDSAEAWTKGDELEEIRAINATRGQVVKWYWWFNDSAGQPNQTDTWNFTVANTAPDITNPIITPSIAYTNNTLVCYTTTTDDDSDKTNVSAKFYLNDSVVIDLDNNSNFNNGSNVTFTLNSGNFTKDDNITCGVRSYDGVNYSSWKNSSILTISNYIPTVPIIIDPSNNSYLATSNVLHNYSSSDIDIEDTITYHIFVNDTLNLSTTINATINYSDGSYSWKVKAGDGTDNSSNSSTYYFVVDTTYPTISVTFPANNSNLSQTWINITGTASDTNNDTVVINDTRFGSNQGTYQNWNFTNTSIADGTYSVLITANDSANNTNSTNVVFTIDKTAPTWSNNETNASDTTKTNESVYFNVTFNDSNPANYTFAINHTGNWVNYSGTYTSGVPIQNITTISATRGEFVSWYFWANDTFGNSNQTDMWNFTVANTAPTFNESLTNQEVTTPNSLNYDVNCSDADSDPVTYYVNSTMVDINSSTGLINDTTTAESETGSYSINVSCGDGYDNNSQSFNYTIKDGTNPVTNLTVPADNYYNDSAASVDVNFTCNASDGYNLKNISLYITDSSNESFSLNSSRDITGTSDWANWTLSLAVGNYTWNCLTYDEYNNSDWADDNRTLKINYTAPAEVSWNQSSLNLGLGAQGSGNLTGSADISSTKSNTNVVVACSSGNCSVITDDWDDTTDMTDGQSLQGNFSCSDSSAGNFSAIFNVTSDEDTSPNQIDVTCNISADTTAPTWSNNETNASDTTKTQQSVYFNVTLDDNIAGGYYIFAFYNGTDWVNDSAETWTKGDELEEIKTINATRNQTVQWYWWFNDSAGQPNQTDTWNFTIANTAPTFNESLTNQEVTTPNSLSYDVNCSDADSDNITYYVNDTMVDINSSTGLINDTTTAESETGSYSINVSCGDGYDNNSQSFNYTIKDGTNPVTNLTVPADNYYNDSAASVDVNFTCNASDGYNLKNISLYITDSSNESFSLNSSRDITGTANWSNWTLSLAVGNYTWNCLTYDEYNNSDWADDNRTLKINYTDAAAPTWSNNKTNASDSTKTNESVYFNVTFTDSNPDTYIFAINQTGQWVNYSGSYSSGVSIENISTITATEGTFVSWYFWANDTFGNSNQTDMWNFTVASFAPTWSNNLTNASDLTQTGQSVYFNVTFNDSNPANYTFAINHTGIWVNYTGSYTSGVQIQNISTIIATRGQFVSWYFWANDTLGNSNQTDVWNFTIANSVPVISGVPDNSTDEDTTPPDKFYNFSLYTSDADNDVLTYAIQSQSNESLINCSIAYGDCMNCSTPTANQSGSSTIVVNVTDGEAWANDTFVVTVNAINDAPWVTSVNITSSDSLNRTNGTLIAAYTFGDVESTVESANETRWYKNGTEVSSLGNKKTVRAGNTKKGQNWTFSVRVYDGANWSSWQNSSVFAILNTAPQFSAMANQSWVMNSNKTINLSVYFSDADNESLSYTNTTVSNMSITISNGIAILGPQTDWNDTRYVIFTANDSEDTVNTTNITLTVFRPQFNWSEFSGATTNFSNITSFINIPIIIENPNWGKINFPSVDLNERVIDLDAHVNISEKRIEVNSSALSILNKSATLYFYNLTFTEPRPVMDGSACPTSICTEVDYSGGTFAYTVTHFAVFSVEETPVTPPAPPSGGGGGYAPTKPPKLPHKAMGAEFVKIPVIKEIPIGQSCVLGVKIKSIIDRSSTVQIGTRRIPAEWVSLKPASISLEPNETKEITISVSVPEGTKAGDYEIGVVATGAGIDAQDFFILRARHISPEYDKPIITRFVEIDTEEGKTNVEIEVSNPQPREYPIVEVVEHVPKTMAEHSNEIEFGTTPSEILREDPLIQWDVLDLKPGETRNIYYSLKKILSELTTYIYWPLHQVNIITQKAPTKFKLVELKIPTLSPGKTSTISLKVENLDEVQHEFGFLMDLPPDWELEPEEIEETIGAGETKEWKLSLSVPRGAETGTYVIRAIFGWDEDAIIREYPVMVKFFPLFLIYVVAIIIILALIAFIVSRLKRWRYRPRIKKVEVLKRIIEQIRGKK